MAFFGENVEDVCQKCKPYVISFDFGFEAFGQKEKENIIEEISSSWRHFEHTKGN